MQPTMEAMTSSRDGISASCLHALRIQKRLAHRAAEDHELVVVLGVGVTTFAGGHGGVLGIGEHGLTREVL